MKTYLIKYFCLFIFISLVPISNVLAQSHDQAESIINTAISQAGGAETWHDNGTLNIREFQKRYEEGGVVIVNLMHNMNTDGSGYRIELARQGGNLVYGWDGTDFWAMVDGKPGDDDEVREARRVISDAYFRFSLPFVLERDIHDLEYTGTDSLYGRNTKVLKMTYDQGPADRYFSGHADEHGEHSSENDHNAGSEDQAEGEHGGGHGHGSEEYFFHFAENGDLVKVYFSHHGDGTYETLLYKNIKKVGGINREHIRTLFRPDGNIHYESFFSKIEFSNSVDSRIYEKP